VRVDTGARQLTNISPVCVWATEPEVRPMDADRLAATERGEIRTLLTTNIRALDERIQATWADELDPEVERLQLERLRVLAHLTRQYRLLARDVDLDEMELQVDTLQAAIDTDLEP
jgi:hypothetical protein